MPVLTRSSTQAKATPKATPKANVKADETQDRPIVSSEPIVLKNGVTLLSQKELEDMGLQYTHPSQTDIPVIIKIDNDDLVQREFYTSVTHNIKTKNDCAKLGKVYALAPRGQRWYMQWYQFCSGDEEWLLKNI